MAQTYEQVQKQIELLQQRAQKLLQREAIGVIERIKEAIAHYGITAAQLGFESSTAPSVTIGSKAKSSASQSPKFADGNGNVWSGRGPRPRWLREALTAGKALEDFVGTATTTAANALLPKAMKKVKPTKRKNAAAKAKAKSTSRPRYKDDAGREWSGMGPRPKWLKEAIASGKTLEQLSR
jgi:DNA-binding protein H-NS